MDYLGKNYKKEMTFENAVKLGVDALKKIIGKGFGSERLEGAFIEMKDKTFQKISKELLK